ncbi:SLA class II histocompatibility antigen, DQ haplotype C beta chain-like [Eublepharis macularius]|uniref:SLA class II histocompatibility antigen, DQ haplotype C beta chain-like n=1 Tax=Eublepharis macularius TaxID=481883 RepID=A0AA97J8B4_EUBMA|nr:SLA class II histocompatibility antigen, DQ haplotype C beta chain-like [Eublepharis macularius]
MGSGLILICSLQLTVLLGPSLVHGGGDPQFLLQSKDECHFANGTAGEVHYLRRLIYNGQEYLRFDSRLGRFKALLPLGEPEAQSMNSNPQVLEIQSAQVDSCPRTYEVFRRIIGRKVQPTVKISPTKANPQSLHTLLICTVAGYYPSEIKIKWLKNGQEQTEGVGYSEDFQNGDWTYQKRVVLETVPERGDVYACQVEHSSLNNPLAVQWEPWPSASAKSKLWVGTLGAMLGLAFIAVGLSWNLKKKGLIT